MSEYVLNERGTTWALRYWRMHAPPFRRLTVEAFERLCREDRMDYLIRVIADLPKRSEEAPQSR
jgi:hypothetical protein